jgi:hypothetical protein
MHYLYFRYLLFTLYTIQTLSFIKRLLLECCKKNGILHSMNIVSSVFFDRTESHGETKYIECNIFSFLTARFNLFINAAFLQYDPIVHRPSHFVP